MNAVRGLLVVVLLLELALIVVFLEARATRLRYALARKHEAIRAAAVEKNKLMNDVAEARRPDALARKAIEFGLPVKEP